MAQDPADVLTCSVCMNGYNSTTRRPFDLGCGHSFCEECISRSPRSFRNCPECRARASNPHANIALLRLLDAMDGTAAGGAGAGGGGGAAAAGSGPRQRQQRQQQQQQQQQRHQPTPAFGPSGVFQGSANQPPIGSLGTMLNQVTAAIPAAGSGSTGSTGSSGQQNPVLALPGSLATHKANIAQMRTSMWVYLTPLLGMLYILSPLDIIPDFLPLVGWIDDALVLYYVVCSLYQLLRDRGAATRA